MTRRTAIAALGCTIPAALGAGKIAVIAHRGEHRSNPENTVAAISAAASLGCDYVEIDVRTTRDGGLVLMHGESVDATTDGKGAVAGMTLREVRALRTPGQPIPTLDEALEAMPGRCGVYLDAKRVSADDIVAALTRHRIADRAVVYGGFALLKELAEKGYARVTMPEAVSAAVLTKSLAELKPGTVAFDRRDFHDEIIAIARRAGTGIFVDRLGVEDTRAAWEDAIGRGATGIQTDKPAELLAVLRSLGRHG